MGIGRRLRDIWRARSADDPEDFRDSMDATLQRHSANLSQVRRSVADVETSRKRVQVRINQLLVQTKTLDTEAEAAVARGDDDAARAALTRKVGLEKAAADLEAQRAQLQGEEDTLRRSADEIERQVEDFRIRRDTLSARHTSATARGDLNDADTGLTSSMSSVNQQMEAAERHTRELEAQADAVDELAREGITTRAGESAEEAERRRFDELLGSAPTPPAELESDGTMGRRSKETPMARTRFRPDRGLSLRMGGVGIGLGALYVLFGAVLIAATKSAVLGIVIVVAMAWGQWYFSDKLALKSIGGQEVSPEQAPELHAMIDRLCVLADMPKPRVAVANTDLPNAFATGRTPNHSVVCVTTGIMQRLDADELEGVLAHELAHVANRDVSIMTVASSLGLLAGFLSRWGFYLGGMFGGGNRDRNNNGGGLPFFAVLIISMVVYFVSFLLTRALSRYRELSADRSGAFLTGRPSKLASALTKISGEMSRIPQGDLREAQALNAFFFAPAISRESIGALFSTHPPLERRLENLARVGNELSETLMGLLDSLLGRTKPPQANLDDLFAVPQAIISLSVLGFEATGAGSVCYRDSDGVSDDKVIDEARAVIGVDASASVDSTDDDHGFRWLTVTRSAADVSGLVNDLHAVNSSLSDAGFGPALLCSTIGLTTPTGGPAALVYLFKQGTFYPFVPTDGRHRDNTLELQIRSAVESDLPVEAKLERWLALWGAPGLVP